MSLKKLDLRVPFKQVKAHMCRVRKRYKEENPVPTVAPQTTEPSGSQGDRITCPICKDIIKGKPWVNNPCGHGFCKTCSDNAYKESTDCVMCREKIESRIRFYTN